MNTIEIIVVSTLFILITIYATWKVAGAFAAEQASKAALEAENKALATRVTALESQNKAPAQKRHSHSTTAGLEDALAVTIDLLNKQKADQARTAQLLSILQQVREGPSAYDPDRPAGHRPENFDN
jgi:type IV secretory pathway TrbL component